MNDEIQLRAVLETLIKNKVIIVFVFFIFFAGAWIYGLNMDDLYVSKAVILPIDANAGGGSGMLANFAGNLGFVPGALGQSQESKKMMAFLNSNSLAYLVAKNVGDKLYQELFPDSWDHSKKIWIMQPKKFEIAEALKGRLKFQENFESGTMSFIAKFKSPDLPARVVAEYLVVLQEYLANNELTIAERNKNFIGKQLKTIQKTFLENGKSLSKYHNKLNVSSLSSSVDVDLNHPMHAFKNDSDMSLGKNENIIKNIPSDIYLKYLTGRQEILSKLILNMEQQYQISMIESEKDRLSFHVIDEPEVSIHPSEPNRRHINAIGALIGLVIGVFMAFLKEFFVANRGV